MSDNGGAEVTAEDGDAQDYIKIGNIEEYDQQNDTQVGQVEERAEVEDEEMSDGLPEMHMSDYD